jgi:DeoR/GlpR family transcriptional regulator of sugar metabolism
MTTATPDEALPRERQQWILERLRSHGRVVSAELAQTFRVSEDAVRRDLRELAAQGLCKRVYGGALPLSAAATPLKQRRHEHAGRKAALARKAVTLVRQDQVLLIDAGSTNAAIAAALPENFGLTVVTNAPDVARVLIDREGFQIVLIGGRIHAGIGGAVGAQAVKDIGRGSVAEAGDDRSQRRDRGCRDAGQAGLGRDISCCRHGRGASSGDRACGGSRHARRIYR